VGSEGSSYYGFLAEILPKKFLKKRHLHFCGNVIIEKSGMQPPKLITKFES
jgi:hypothetical protein